VRIRKFEGRFADRIRRKLHAFFKLGAGCDFAKARYGRLLTDALWQKIRPLLPKWPKRPKGGTSPKDDRDVLEGALWILRSGKPCRDIRALLADRKPQSP
jgi:hypothetical protein